MRFFINRRWRCCLDHADGFRLVCFHFLGGLAFRRRARRLSHATMRNIRQNLFFAFVFNALAVPIAAGVLYPALGLLLNPMIASAAMSLSSVLVVTNALRLRRFQPPIPPAEGAS